MVEPDVPPQSPAFRPAAIAVLALYLLGLGLGIGAGVVDGLLGLRSGADRALERLAEGADPSPMAVAMTCGGVIFLLGMLAVYAFLIHGLWRVVQDGRARLSPVAGTLLAVVPIVHLVGMFFGFAGLAKDLNRVGEGMGAPPVNEALAVAACVCCAVGTVFGCIPFIGCLFSPIALAGLVLWFIVLFQMAASGTVIAEGQRPVAEPSF